MQAKDIPPGRIIASVEFARLRNLLRSGHDVAFRWDLERDLPGIPPKVILAKVRRLIDAGRLDGCPCGCRGDFEVVE